MCEKDYSLLRPFDKDVVKAGDLLIHISTSLHRTFVCGPDPEGYIITSDSQGLLFIGHQRNWKITPLCWVEGKPVYSDSILYNIHSSIQYLGKDINNTKCFTWGKPKEKKTGWVNVYPMRLNGYIYETEAEANNHASDDRVACIQIEWEE